MDLDTRTGDASFVLAEPRTIDFVAIEKATYGAGYTLKGVTIELEGRIVKADCEECGEEVPTLRIPATGQELELTGDAPPEGSVWLKATVSDWAGSHAQLNVLEWREST